MILPLDGTRQEGVPPTTKPLPTPTNIPAQFRGRWGINTADCEPGRSDATVVTAARDVRVIRFRPPRISQAQSNGAPSPWPHIRLDRALDFLVGDHLT